MASARSGVTKRSYDSTRLVPGAAPCACSSLVVYGEQAEKYMCWLRLARVSMLECKCGARVPCFIADDNSTADARRTSASRPRPNSATRTPRLPR